MAQHIRGSIHTVDVFFFFFSCFFLHNLGCRIVMISPCLTESDTPIDDASFQPSTVSVQYPRRSDHHIRCFITQCFFFVGSMIKSYFVRVGSLEFKSQTNIHLH